MVPHVRSAWNTALKRVRLRGQKSLGYPTMAALACRSLDASGQCYIQVFRESMGMRSNLSPVWRIAGRLTTIKAYRRLSARLLVSVRGGAKRRSAPAPVTTIGMVLVSSWRSFAKPAVGTTNTSTLSRPGQQRRLEADRLIRRTGLRQRCFGRRPSRGLSFLARTGLSTRLSSVPLGSALDQLPEPTRAVFPVCCASAPNCASVRLSVKTTASPINRMGTSVEDGWRESS